MTPGGWCGRARTATSTPWGRFFDDLGAERAAQLTQVSADGAEWIHDVVTARAPQAVLCLDAFHVVAWATEALDAVRRAMVNQLRADGRTDEATALKGRWALLENPPNLTGDQRTTLAGIAQANGGLYRAYLLKEQLREIFACRDLTTAKALLGGWISWAQRSRLPAFIKLTAACGIVAVATPSGSEFIVRARLHSFRRTGARTSSASFST
ncbi:MAG: ISL3 family transposase [Candidatus Dormibacteria bacterium]